MTIYNNPIMKQYAQMRGNTSDWGSIANNTAGEMADVSYGDADDDNDEMTPLEKEELKYKKIQNVLAGISVVSSSIAILTSIPGCINGFKGLFSSSPNTNAADNSVEKTIDSTKNQKSALKDAMKAAKNSGDTAALTQEITTTEALIGQNNVLVENLRNRDSLTAAETKTAEIRNLEQIAAEDFTKSADNVKAYKDGAYKEFFDAKTVAETNLTEADKAYTEANDAVTSAQNEIDTYTDILGNMERKLNEEGLSPEVKAELNARISDLKKSIEAAKTRLEEAASQLSVAKTQKAEAEEALKIAETNFEKAETELKKLEDIRDNASTAWDLVREELRTQEGIEAETKTAYEENVKRAEVLEKATQKLTEEQKDAKELIKDIEKKAAEEEEKKKAEEKKKKAGEQKK